MAKNIKTETKSLKAMININVANYTSIIELIEKQVHSKGTTDLDSLNIQQYNNLFSFDKDYIPLVNKHFVAHLEKFQRRATAKNPDFVMNKQQENALKHILCSKDKIIMIEGLPGIGQSTVLNAVRDISNRKLSSLIGLGTEFKGLASTASATKTLKNSAELIDANTIHNFLSKYSIYLEGRGKDSLKFQKQEFKKTMLFVDECSLLSTNVMWKLLNL